MQQFELVFVGSALARYMPRYKRRHATIAEAEKEACRVREILDADQAGGGSYARASHNPIIYGPGCGDAGRPVKW